MRVGWALAAPVGAGSLAWLATALPPGLRLSADLQCATAGSAAPFVPRAAAWGTAVVQARGLCRPVVRAPRPGPAAQAARERLGPRAPEPASHATQRPDGDARAAVRQAAPRAPRPKPAASPVRRPSARPFRASEQRRPLPRSCLGRVRHPFPRHPGREPKGPRRPRLARAPLRPLRAARSGTQPRARRRLVADACRARPRPRPPDESSSRGAATARASTASVARVPSRASWPRECRRTALRAATRSAACAPGARRTVAPRSLRSSSTRSAHRCQFPA